MEGEEHIGYARALRKLALVGGFLPRELAKAKLPCLEWDLIPFPPPWLTTSCFIMPHLHPVDTEWTHGAVLRPEPR